MTCQDKTANVFIREIPFVVLIIFWAVYIAVEVIGQRLDVLSSVIPTGLFLMAYGAVKIKTKKSHR